MKKTERLLIRLEIMTIAVMMLLCRSRPAALVLAAAGWLLMLLLYTSLTRIRTMRLHTRALPDLLVEFPILAYAVLSLQPVFSLMFIIIWYYRLFERVSGYAVYITGAVTWALLLIPSLMGIVPASAGESLYIPGILLAPWLGYLLAHQEHEDLSQLQADVNRLRLQIQNKNKLLSTLSHELRTPLTVIQTSTEILQEGRPGPINETQRRFLDSTHANVRRMIRLVENILAQIKVEHTLFTLEKSEMDIRMVVRKVIRNMKPFIDDQNQEIRYSFPNMIDHVMADDKWIEQVLINLIHNASKHVSSGGHILVTVKQNERCVVVSVNDDGSGIDRDERPKIFAEFYQGKDAKNDIMNGAGLGLAIVEDIIGRHDGKVYISSVLGHGTTISFTLPKEEVQ